MGGLSKVDKSRCVSRLEMEAVSLFGKQFVQLAKMLSMEELAIEAEQVAEGARQLREQSGKPDRQRAIIRCMDQETALALCKWICEPACMDAYIAKAAH